DWTSSFSFVISDPTSTRNDRTTSFCSTVILKRWNYTIIVILEELEDGIKKATLELRHGKQ
ncbi:hypothetical protein Csa_023636, partial [Cucumis sativus]